MPCRAVRIQLLPAAYIVVATFSDFSWCSFYIIVACWILIELNSQREHNLDVENTFWRCVNGGLVYLSKWMANGEDFALFNVNILLLKSVVFTEDINGKPLHFGKPNIVTRIMKLKDKNARQNRSFFQFKSFQCYLRYSIREI